MISNEKKLWHYLTVEKLAPLLRGISPKCHEEF